MRSVAREAMKHGRPDNAVRFQDIEQGVMKGFIVPFVGGVEDRHEQLRWRIDRRNSFVRHRIVNPHAPGGDTRLRLPAVT
jgi:hypothetical protein